MAKAQDYESALRELEQLHDSGQIDDTRYQVHKTRMLGELANPHAGDFARVVRIVVLTPVAIFVVSMLVVLLVWLVGLLA